MNNNNGFYFVNDEEKELLKERGIKVKKNGEVYKKDQAKATDIINTYRNSQQDKLFKDIDKIYIDNRENTFSNIYEDIIIEDDNVDTKPKQALPEDQGKVNSTQEAIQEVTQEPKQRLYGVTDPTQIKGTKPEIFVPNGPRPAYMDHAHTNNNAEKAINKFGKWKGAAMVAGALALGGLALNMADNRGQLSNAQLYGQRPLY